MGSNSDLPIMKDAVKLRDKTLKIYKNMLQKVELLFLIM